MAGGVARATVLSGGVEADFGTARGTVILSGGRETVAGHGVASGSRIDSGGLELVSSGGTVAAAQLFVGGALTVLSGGAVSGGLVIHNGLATIDGTVAAGQIVNFAGLAGVLRLDNLAGFNAKISGMTTAKEKIDLGGFVFGSGETVTWTQSGTSGTLTVHDDAPRPPAWTLIGTYDVQQLKAARRRPSRRHFRFR